jgi:hypothetical protein
MSVDAKQELKIFRAALFPLSLAISGPALVIVLGLNFRLFGWKHLEFKSLVEAAVAVEIAGIVCAWVISVCFPNKLGPSGVWGHSFWGVPRFIRWQDIREAKPLSYLSFTFLRLYPTDGTGPTWIALSQARKQEFAEEIRKLAPPESPLRPFVTG